MQERKKIGLREVRALNAGTTILDAVVTGFGARRHKGDAVSYFIHYRTKEGRQRWRTRRGTGRTSQKNKALDVS
ncbi:MAG: hypothetical protein PHS57_02360 [Alphaproteobacteria bacterium]|nr:hypothetical protein [Alphaproteobacteria bacterium]